MFNEAPLKVQGYGREAPHRVTYRLNLQARHTHIRPLKGCFLPGFLLSPQGKGQLSSIQTQLTQGPKEKGDFPSLGSRPTTPVLISPPRTSHFLDSWQRIAEPRRRSHASQAKLEAWSRKVSHNCSWTEALYLGEDGWQQALLLPWLDPDAATTPWQPPGRRSAQGDQQAACIPRADHGLEGSHWLSRDNFKNQWRRPEAAAQPISCLWWAHLCRVSYAAFSGKSLLTMNAFSACWGPMLGLMGKGKEGFN